MYIIQIFVVTWCHTLRMFWGAANRCLPFSTCRLWGDPEENRTLCRIYQFDPLLQSSPVYTSISSIHSQNLSVKWNSFATAPGPPSTRTSAVYSATNGPPFAAAATVRTGCRSRGSATRRCSRNGCCPACTRPVSPWRRTGAETWHRTLGHLVHVWYWNCSWPLKIGCWWQNLVGSFRWSLGVEKWPCEGNGMMTGIRIGAEM